MSAELNSRNRTLLVGALLAVGIIAAVFVAFVLIPSSGGTPAPVAKTSNPGNESPSTEDTRAEVERAYLRFWKVWAEANLKLEPKPMEEVASGEQLRLLTEQIEEQRAANQPVRVSIEHSYEILLTGPETASVEDQYVIHSVRLDPRTMQPIEPDPNTKARKSHTLKKVNGRWTVAEIIEYR